MLKNTSVAMSHHGSYNSSARLLATHVTTVICHTQQEAPTGQRQHNLQSLYIVGAGQ